MTETRTQFDRAVRKEGESGMITYECEHCGAKIANGAGGIAVSYTDIATYQKAMKEFEDAHRTESGAVVVSGTDFADMPEAAHWHTAHWQCLEETGVVNPYDIRAEDIRTYRAVVDWVAHLLGKTWVQDTDLAQWLRTHV